MKNIKDTNTNQNCFPKKIESTIMQVLLSPSVKYHRRSLKSNHRYGGMNHVRVKTKINAKEKYCAMRDKKFSYQLDKNSRNNPAVVNVIPILDNKMSFDSCFPCLISYSSQVSFLISKGLHMFMNLLSFCFNRESLDLKIITIPAKPNIKPGKFNISNENELILPSLKEIGFIL